MSWTPCSLDSPTVSVEVYRADQTSIPARLTDGRIGSRIIAITVGRMLLFGGAGGATHEAAFHAEFDLRSYALNTRRAGTQRPAAVVPDTWARHAAGPAANGIRTRQVTLDLGPLSPGHYQLAIRRDAVSVGRFQHMLSKARTQDSESLKSTAFRY
jgi:hypothetical protein